MVEVVTPPAPVDIVSMSFASDSVTITTALNYGGATGSDDTGVKVTAS